MTVTTQRQFFSIQVKDLAHVAILQDAPKPVDLV
jgi:hypothetical protein